MKIVYKNIVFLLVFYFNLFAYLFFICHLSIHLCICLYILILIKKKAGEPKHACLIPLLPYPILNFSALFRTI